MALAICAMMCEDAGDEFLGIGPAPKHYNAVFGRPDEERWVDTDCPAARHCDASSFCTV